MTQWLRVLKQQLQQIYIFFLEFRVSKIRQGKSNLDVCETKLLVLAHALEKGMGMKKVKRGYGQEKAMILLDQIEVYRKSKKDRNSFSYLETLAVLKKYIEFQKAENVNIGTIEKRYTQMINSETPEIIEVSNGYSVGARDFSYDELTNHGGSFEDLLSSRHTVRSFSNKEIDIEDLKKVIELANKAPSACNRQPTKVYYARQQDSREEIDRLITGNAGFKGELHNYLVLTCDRACFQYVEEFQWYVNGGIYLGYLSLALHACKMGSCIMQWFPFHKNEKRLKDILGVKHTETIIAIVGFGYFEDENRCLCAQRRDVEKALTIV